MKKTDDEILQEAISLIEGEGRWCKGAWARNKSGAGLGAWWNIDRSPHSYCMEGAIVQACIDDAAGSVGVFRGLGLIEKLDLMLEQRVRVFNDLESTSQEDAILCLKNLTEKLRNSVTDVAHEEQAAAGQGELGAVGRGVGAVFVQHAGERLAVLGHLRRQVTLAQLQLTPEVGYTDPRDCDEDECAAWFAVAKGHHPDPVQWATDRAAYSGGVVKTRLVSPWVVVEGDKP